MCVQSCPLAPSAIAVVRGVLLSTRAVWPTNINLKNRGSICTKPHFTKINANKVVWVKSAVRCAVCTVAQKRRGGGSWIINNTMNAPICSPLFWWNKTHTLGTEIRRVIITELWIIVEHYGCWLLACMIWVCWLNPMQTLHSVHF